MMEDRSQIGKQNILISYVQIDPTGFFLLIIECPLAYILVTISVTKSIRCKTI